MHLENAYFTVENLNGTRGAANIMKDLNPLPGVSSVQVSVRRKNVAIHYNPTDIQSANLQQKLSDMGYSVFPTSTF